MIFLLPFAYVCVLEQCVDRGEDEEPLIQKRAQRHREEETEASPVAHTQPGAAATARGLECVREREREKKNRFRKSEERDGVCVCRERERESE